MDIEAGAYGTKAHHSDECRLRIYLKHYENNDKKWRDVKGQLSREAKPKGDKEEIRLEGLDKSDAKAMEKPKAPDAPLSQSDHFQSDQRIAEGMQAPGNPLGGPSEAESYDRQDVDEAFDIFMDFPEDDDDMGDPTAASSAMEAALVAAGTRKDAARLFVKRIVGNAGATTFMEMYGQGTIVSEANRTRRSLNCEGLQVFVLRTNKPDNCPWNFCKREDRKSARQRIADDDPGWT